MHKFIWLVPLLPLVGAAINGIFGRWFRFPEKLIGGIAVASVALAFLISLAAVYSYGFSGNSLWPNPYVTTQTAFTWIPGVIWLVLKIWFFFFLFAMVKAIVPRYRYDQLMRLGWKVFLPVSLVWVVLTAGYLIAIGHIPG